MRRILSTIVILLLASTAQAGKLVYKGNSIPETTGDYSTEYWTKSTEAGVTATIEKVGKRRVLHLDDNSSSGGSHMFLSRKWKAVPPTWYNSASFRVKAVSCNGELGSYFAMQAMYDDGSEYHVFYNLLPDRLDPAAGNPAPDYFVDTTVYRTYTIVLYQGVSSIYVDGQLAFTHNANPGLYGFARNGVEFGCGSSNAQGEAYWDNVDGRQRKRPPRLAPGVSKRLTFLWGAIRSE